MLLFLFLTGAVREAPAALLAPDPGSDAARGADAGERRRPSERAAATQVQPQRRVRAVDRRARARAGRSWPR